MKTKTLRISLFTAALLLLALPVGARADFRSGNFALKGTHGYTIRFELSSGDQEVTASRNVKGKQEKTEYTRFEEAPDGGRMVANFGRLGRVAVRFRPTSRGRQPSHACKGDPDINQRGFFEGVIRFRGERGYTQVSAKRARGSLFIIPERKCHHGTAGASSVPDDEDSPLITSLAATSTAAPVAFAAEHAEGEEARFGTRFVAVSSEERGDLFIDRSVTVQAPAATFAYDPALNSATVSPPAPFAGSASFQRLDDFSSRWQGPLTVSFPGRPAIPLTGRDFSWSLRQEREDEISFDSIFGELLFH